MSTPESSCDVLAIEWQRLEELFHRAVDLADGEQEKLLNGLDGPLRAALQELLTSDGDAPLCFLEPPDSADPEASARVSEASAALSRLVGRQLGPFRVERLVGVGGMGAVYAARQRRPDRLVALKVLKPSLFSDQAAERLAFETEVLGHMQHEGIARIFSAGLFDTDDLGRLPWIAMEYLEDARSLTEAAAGLSSPDRVMLFVRVLDAVQYSHGRGVIHRDLKPANILVVGDAEDAGPRSLQPKVIDFGVARAEAEAYLRDAPRTAPSQIVGTLQYMSPEQADGDVRQVDARSDVYSLGVVLFELLCGRLPYEFSGAGVASAVRAIHEKAPRRLSEVHRDLRGDLDAIVAKALEKEPGERYQSAAEFGADLNRWLENKPIEAKPRSAWYHLKLFAKRNRALSAVIAAAMLVAVGAGVAVTIAAIEAAVQAQRASENEAEAIAQRLVADAVNEFFSAEVLSQASPEALGIAVTLREAVDRAAALVEDRFADQPRIRAAIHHTLGETYIGLADHARMRHHFEAAYRLRRNALGNDHADTLRSQAEFAGSLPADQAAEAERMVDGVLSRQRLMFGDEGRDTIRSQQILASIYASQGRLREQLAVLQSAQPALVANHGPKAAETLRGRVAIAVVHRMLGEHEMAEAIFDEVYADMVGEFGADHPQTLQLMFQMAICYREMGRLQLAEQYYLASYERRRDVLGEENVHTMASAAGLALIYKKQGKFDDAEPLYQRAFQTQRESLGPDELLTLSTQHNLGSLYKDSGRYADAIELYDDLVQRARRVLGNEHWYLGVFLTAQGECFAGTGRPDDARRAWIEAHDILSGALGEDHSRTVRARTHLEALDDQRR